MTTVESIQVALELSTAFFAVICAFFSYMTRKYDSERHRFIQTFLGLSIILMAADVFQYINDGINTTASHYILCIAEFVLYSVYPLMTYSVSAYLTDLINDRGLVNNYSSDKKGEDSKDPHKPDEQDIKFENKYLRYMRIVCCLHNLVIIANLFFKFIYTIDAGNNYHRSAGYFIAPCFGFLELVLLFVMLNVGWHSLSGFVRTAISAFLILPLITNLIQLFYYGFSLTELMSSLCMILFFMLHEVEKSVRIREQRLLIERNTQLLNREEEQLKKLAAKLDEQKEALARRESALNLAYTVSSYYKNQLSAVEQQLSDAQVQISISQMQPHFIFNALGSIEQLCHFNPKKAAEATHQFAVYLRNNLIALSSVELKDFSMELSHIQAYIWLEKMRFGEDLEYVEDIQCKNFSVPVLSIQPLVENAVKHGMSSSVDEGVLHVSLKTWEDKDYYYVEISDDGNGFNPDDLPKDSRVHVGLINCRERIRHMLNGELRVKSAIGQGATFTVVIPKLQEENE